MKQLSRREFTKALKSMPLPGAKIRKFLAIHAAASGRAATMTKLAQAVGYAGFQGMNLQYGLLASRIGRAAGLRKADLDLLVEFIVPKSLSDDNVSNSEWVLIMREEFAKALKDAGWVPLRTPTRG